MASLRCGAIHPGRGERRSGRVAGARFATRRKRQLREPHAPGRHVQHLPGRPDTPDDRIEFIVKARHRVHLLRSRERRDRDAEERF